MSEPEPYEILRGVRDHGMGEGPRKPISRGEQFIFVPENLYLQQGFLDKIRPWTTLIADPHDLATLGEDKLIAWSFSTIEGYMFVSCLRFKGRFDSRPAYISQTFLLPPRQTYWETSVVEFLGQIEKFDFQVPNNESKNKDAPTNGYHSSENRINRQHALIQQIVEAEPQKKSNRLIQTVISQLFSAVIHKRCLLIYAPTQVLFEDKEDSIKNIFSFAIRALPEFVQQQIRARFYSHRPERLFHDNKANVLIITEEAYEDIQIDSKYDFLDASTGQLTGGNEAQGFYKNYANLILKSFTKFPKVLNTFTFLYNEECYKEHYKKANHKSNIISMLYNYGFAILNHKGAGFVDRFIYDVAKKNQTIQLDKIIDLTQIKDSCPPETFYQLLVNQQQDNRLIRLAIPFISTESGNKSSFSKYIVSWMKENVENQNTDRSNSIKWKTLNNLLASENQEVTKLFDHQLKFEIFSETPAQELIANNLLITALQTDIEIQKTTDIKVPRRWQIENEKQLIVDRLIKNLTQGHNKKPSQGILIDCYRYEIIADSSLIEKIIPALDIDGLKSWWQLLNDKAGSSDNAIKSYLDHISLVIDSLWPKVESDSKTFDEFKALWIKYQSKTCEKIEKLLEQTRLSLTSLKNLACFEYNVSNTKDQNNTYTMAFINNLIKANGNNSINNNIDIVSRAVIDEVLSSNNTKYPFISHNLFIKDGKINQDYSHWLKELDKEEGFYLDKSVIESLDIDYLLTRINQPLSNTRKKQIENNTFEFITQQFIKQSNINEIQKNIELIKKLLKHGLWLNWRNYLSKQTNDISDITLLKYYLASFNAKSQDTDDRDLSYEEWEQVVKDSKATGVNSEQIINSFKEIPFPWIPQFEREQLKQLSQLSTSIKNNLYLADWAHEEQTNWVGDKKLYNLETIKTFISASTKEHIKFNADDYYNELIGYIDNNHVEKIKETDLSKYYNSFVDEERENYIHDIEERVSDKIFPATKNLSNDSASALTFFLQTQNNRKYPIFFNNKANKFNLTVENIDAITKNIIANQNLLEVLNHYSEFIVIKGSPIKNTAIKKQLNNSGFKRISDKFYTSEHIKKINTDLKKHLDEFIGDRSNFLPLFKHYRSPQNKNISFIKIAKELNDYLENIFLENSISGNELREIPINERTHLIEFLLNFAFGFDETNNITQQKDNKNSNIFFKLLPHRKSTKNSYKINKDKYLLINNENIQSLINACMLISPNWDRDINQWIAEFLIEMDIELKEKQHFIDHSLRDTLKEIENNIDTPEEDNQFINEEKELINKKKNIIKASNFDLAYGLWISTFYNLMETKVS